MICRTDQSFPLSLTEPSTSRMSVDSGSIPIQVGLLFVIFVESIEIPKYNVSPISDLT